jgi:hypothetical protein
VQASDFRLALSQPPYLLLQLGIDPWRLRLERVRGTIGFDGLERISSQNLRDCWSLMAGRQFAFAT